MGRPHLPLLGILSLSVTLGAAGFFACGGDDTNSAAGDGGGADGSVSDGAASTDGASAKDSSSSGSFALTADDASVASELRALNVLHVTLTPSGGFSGSVALSATGLPTGVSASFSPTNVSLSASAAQSELDVYVPPNVVATPQTLTINADGNGFHASVALTLTVSRVLTIPIYPDPADAAEPYGPVPILVTLDDAGISALNPITVNFFNHDTVPHEIHADNGTEGFGHDVNPFAGGSLDPLVRQVNSPGTYDFYLHDLAQPDGGPPNERGRLIIQ